MEMEGSWNASSQVQTGADNNRYRYNGKELNKELGLYDYGARWYDPAIARWSVVDALADAPEQIDKSPYAYGWNNPIRYNDPDGNCPKCVIQAMKVTRKAYKAYKKAKKAGRKFTSKDLKEVGLEEIVDIAGDLATVFGSDASLLDRAGAATDLVLGTDLNSKGQKKVKEVVEQVKGVGKRRRNRVPDKGTPNSTATNSSGTTTKKYGPDGNVQKEYNKGHGEGYPANEVDDHVHDYKPNPYNPSGRGDRQTGRPPKKGEAQKDFDRTNSPGA